jgi:hypothetical protein
LLRRGRLVAGGVLGLRLLVVDLGLVGDPVGVGLVLGVARRGDLRRGLLAFEDARPGGGDGAESGDGRKRIANISLLL